jgi:hypothetical protein
MTGHRLDNQGSRQWFSLHHCVQTDLEPLGLLFCECLELLLRVKATGSWGRDKSSFSMRLTTDVQIGLITRINNRRWSLISCARNAWCTVSTLLMLLCYPQVLMRTGGDYLEKLCGVMFIVCTRICHTSVPLNPWSCDTAIVDSCLKEQTHLSALIPWNIQCLRTSEIVWEDDTIRSISAFTFMVVGEWSYHKTLFVTELMGWWFSCNFFRQLFCFSVSILETRCRERGGECTPKARCGRQLWDDRAQDCSQNEACCILVK